MQLVLLTFVIGVLNLCLGYALAVHLGYGPPTLWDTWDVLRARRPAADVSTGRIAAAEDVVPALEQALVPSPEEALPAEPEDVAEPAVKPEPGDLDAVRRSVDQAIASLTELAGGLNKSRTGRSDKTVWSFVRELQEICDPYAQRLSQAAEWLGDEAGDSGGATAPGDEVEGTLLAQVAQLETTLSNLQHMDFASGFSAALTRLRTDTENTLSVARKLQKALATGAETAGAEKGGSPAN